MTIQSDVERKHINKVYTKDAFAESVIQAWENFNDFTKMQNIMQRWKKVLDLIIQDNGKNDLVESSRVQTEKN